MKSITLFFQVFIAVTVMTAGLATAQPMQFFNKDSLAEKSDIVIGARYNSDYYFMGRSDSAKAPYLSPYIGYYHKSGFFVRGSLSYLTAADEGRVDLITLSGGYDYYGKKFAAGLSASEYFFSDLSFAVQAEMSTYLSAYAGYDFSLLMIYADAGLGFSDATDVFLGIEINRPFFALKNRLRITPALYLNAGTQQYYDQYFKNRSSNTGLGKGKGKGGNAQQPPMPQNGQIVESDKFKVLDYEADLQISYKIQKIRLYISAAWTFPISPATVVTDQGTFPEDLKNGFYWSSGVRFTL